MDSRASFYTVLTYAQMITLHAPQPIVILVTIFLITELRIKQSPFRNPFYFFIFLFTIYYNFVAICWILIYTGIVSLEMKRVYNLMILRYYTLLVGIWNTGVCLNRVTAIALPFKHVTVWSRVTTTIFALLFFCYPLAFQAPFHSNPCWKSVETRECMAYQNLNMYIIAMSVICHAVIAIVLIMMALIYVRYKGWLAARAAEQKLIMQTLATSIILICVGYAKMIAMQNYFYGNFARHMTLSSIGTILLALYSYTVIGGLFLASPSFREKLIDFYRCRRSNSQVRAMYGSQFEVEVTPPNKRPSF